MSCCCSVVACHFHWISQRSGVCGQVFATDASPDGGGACISTGLTRSGFGRVHSLVHEAEGMENGASDPLVVVEMFAGMGGLHQALELLGLTPMGVIGVDISPESARVMRHHCRHIMWYKNVEDITKEEVKRWRAMHPKALRVLISGGWPCVNHSVLNPWRQGANASTSMLLDSMLQIRDWLKIVSAELGLPSWEVCELCENVVMDKSDLESQSAKIGCIAPNLPVALVDVVLPLVRSQRWQRAGLNFSHLPSILLLAKVSSGPTASARSEVCTTGSATSVLRSSRF